MDAADEYWVVRHQIVDDWQDPDTLVRDEEAIAACWAWEQDYMGMEIVGTIHNEVRIDGRSTGPHPRPPECTNRLPSTRAAAAAGRFRSINGSRRGRRGVDATSRFDQRIAGPVRRTRIRRTRARDRGSRHATGRRSARHDSRARDLSEPCGALFGVRVRRAVPGAVRRRRPGTGAGGALPPAAGERPAQAAAWASHLGLRQGRRTAAMEPIVVVLTYISESF